MHIWKSPWGIKVNALTKPSLYTTFFIDWKEESKLLLPNVVFFACLEAFINWKVEGEIPCLGFHYACACVKLELGHWDFQAAQFSCDFSTVIRNQRNQQIQTHLLADLANGDALSQHTHARPWAAHTIPSTDYRLHCPKSNPNPTFLGTPETYFVWHIGPEF